MVCRIFKGRPAPKQNKTIYNICNITHVTHTHIYIYTQLYIYTYHISYITYISCDLMIYDHVNHVVNVVLFCHGVFMIFLHLPKAQEMMAKKLHLPLAEQQGDLGGSLALAV